MRSRSGRRSSKTNLPFMKHLVRTVFVLMLVLAAGCGLFRSKDKKVSQPELPPVAGIEAEFRSRWMDQRVHQLLTSGAAKTEAEARQTAAAEFARSYPFIAAPKGEAAR
jgi:hypothetical protein